MTNTHTNINSPRALGQRQPRLGAARSAAAPSAAGPHVSTKEAMPQLASARLVPARPTPFGLPILALALTLLLSGACATTAPRTTATTALSAPVASCSELDAALASARVVYVGERHGDRRSAAAQLGVLRRLNAMGRQVVVAVEWFPRSAQADIDRWLAGPPLTVEAMAEALDWDQRWGFELETYAPILQWAHANGAAVVGLNAERALSRAVARDGRAGLEGHTGEPHVKLDSADPVHKSYILAMLTAAGQAHGHVITEPAVLDRYYLAQLVWDETMAASVTELIASRDLGDKAIAVFAGHGHVDYRLGIPARVVLPPGASDLVIRADYSRDDDGQESDAEAPTVDALAGRRPADLIWPSE